MDFRFSEMHIPWTVLRRPFTKYAVMFFAKVTDILGEDAPPPEIGTGTKRGRGDTRERGGTGETSEVGPDRLRTEVGGAAGGRTPERGRGTEIALAPGTGNTEDGGQGIDLKASIITVHLGVRVVICCLLK